MPSAEQRPWIVLVEHRADHRDPRGSCLDGARRVLGCHAAERVDRRPTGCAADRVQTQRGPAVSRLEDRREHQGIGPLRWRGLGVPRAADPRVGHQPPGVRDPDAAFTQVHGVRLEQAGEIEAVVHGEALLVASSDLQQAPTEREARARREIGFSQLDQHAAGPRSRQATFDAPEQRGLGTTREVADHDQARRRHFSPEALAPAGAAASRSSFAIFAKRLFG